MYAKKMKQDIFYSYLCMYIKKVLPAFWFKRSISMLQAKETMRERGKPPRKT